jgi:hypothetical protein
LVPAVTGSGESVLVSARSTDVFTVVVAVAVLLPGVGSVVVLAAVTELLIVPAAVFELTFTTIVKTAVSEFATGDLEKTTFPVPPTAGALVLHPLPVVTVADTDVVWRRRVGHAPTAKLDRCLQFTV